MTGPLRDTGRLAHLDGLRCGLATFVVLHHALLTVLPSTQGRLDGLAEPLLGWLRHGRVAVSAFIVVSGFSLAQAVLRSGRLPVRTFLLRRSLRILPPMWIAAGLSVLLLLTVLADPTGTHWDTVLPLRPMDVVTTVTTVRPEGVNHVLWSVAVEWHLCFVFPVLVWLLLARGRAALAAGALGAGVLGAAAATALALPGTIAVTSLYAGLFGLGLAAAAQAQHESAAGSVRRPAAGAVAVTSGTALAALLLALGWAAVQPQWLLLVDPLAGVCVAATLVHLSSARRSALRDLLQRPALVSSGRISYSTYLVHAPVLQLVWLVVVRPTGLTGPAALALLVVAGLPVVAAASRVFHRFAERPFLLARPTSAQTVPARPLLVTQGAP